MKMVCNGGGGGGVQWRQQHLMEATQQLADAQQEDKRAV